MPRTRIKICGITTAEDAQAAADAGADAVGFILYAPGTGRLVDADVARRIAQRLPPFVSAVGVTVDCPVNRVRQLLAHIPLGAVQLHGKESVQDARSVQPTGAIKKLAPTPALASEMEAWRAAIVPNLVGLLIDSSNGTGTPADWAPLEDALGRIGDRATLPRLILAGGLRAENVGELVKRFRPWAVDVSTGVEEEPGRKSPALMEGFIRAVRAADTMAGRT